MEDEFKDVVLDISLAIDMAELELRYYLMKRSIADNTMDDDKKIQGSIDKIADMIEASDLDDDFKTVMLIDLSAMIEESVENYKQLLRSGMGEV